jgi:hypothetical protein
MVAFCDDVETLRRIAQQSLDAVQQSLLIEVNVFGFDGHKRVEAGDGWGVGKSRGTNGNVHNSASVSRAGSPTSCAAGDHQKSDFYQFMR